MDHPLLITWPRRPINKQVQENMYSIVLSDPLVLERNKHGLCSCRKFKPRRRFQGESVSYENVIYTVQLVLVHMDMSEKIEHHHSSTQYIPSDTLEPYI